MITLDKYGAIQYLKPVNHFGKNLSNALQNAGMTQYRLAKVSGVSEQAISGIVIGKKRPTDDILEKFSRVEQLGLDIQTLRAWRLLDMANPAEIRMAFKILKEEEKQK